MRPELPLLLVSGYDADLAAARYASLMPARFLRKPFGREELVGALDSCWWALARANCRGSLERSARLSESESLARTLSRGRR